MIMANHFPEDAYPPSASIQETLKGAGETRPLIVETYSRKGVTGRRFYWRIRHKSNGEIMAQHRGYVRESDRDHAVDVLWPDLRVNPLG
jgi:hypothetical protein